MAKLAHKTVLAIAIAAAASNASALTVTANNDDMVYVAADSHDEIRIEGSAELVGSGAAVSVGTVTNNITNDASFTLTDSSDPGFIIYGDNETSEIGGSIVNNGLIDITGTYVAGMEVVGVEVGAEGVVDDALGNIVNAGTIRVRDDRGAGDPDLEELDYPTAGLLITNTEITGDVINSGTIDVQADDAHGILVDATSGIFGAQGFVDIGRDVINSGDIVVSGAQARGLELRDVNLGLDEQQVGTDVENTGLIRVTGDGSVALRLDETDYNRVYNSGTISANGEGAIGIEIRESLSNQNIEVGTPAEGSDQIADFLVTNGIVNEGYIYAEDTGIRITNDLFNTDPGDTSNSENLYRITQNAGGTIVSGGSAIDGNFQSNLYLNGGQIFGDIEGIRRAFINGNVLVSAELFEANNVDVVSGTLYLAELHTEFTGDITVADGATLATYVGDDTNAGQAIVATDGVISLADGSSLTVTTGQGEFTREKTTFVLLSASELFDHGANVRAATPLLTLTNVQTTGTSMTADIALATGEEATGGLEDIGLDQNGVAATAAFLDGVLANIPTDSALYQRFMNASDAELRMLGAQLQPETNGGAQTASLNSAGLTRSALTSRTNALGANAGDTFIETGVWIKALDGRTDQGSRGGIAGYDADSKGLIIGADGKIDDQTTIGFAIAHIDTDVASDNGNKTDVSSTSLSVYGSWVEGPVTVDGSLTYGMGDNDAKRRVAGDTLKAGYDSDTLSANLSARYDLQLDGNLMVAPVIGTRYTRVDIDGYTERGSAAALTTGDQRLEVFDIGAGLQLDADYGAFKPSARIMAYRDLIQDDTDTTSSFVLGGNSFATSGIESSKWTYEAGIGVEWNKDNLSLSAAYDYTRKADFRAGTTSLTARWDF
ncbi:hypothetical protein LCGC14_0237560 [marine sediment metagenome]|uniref:Autotransporter domain-containing protein n=1 Tax=marine sediment metagenome TaxID=412755 RepID=A0A0F9UD82_9ZZZZ